MHFGIVSEWETITFCCWLNIRSDINIFQFSTVRKCFICQIALGAIYYDSFQFVIVTKRSYLNSFAICWYYNICELRILECPFVNLLQRGRKRYRSNG